MMIAIDVILLQVLAHEPGYGFDLTKRIETTYGERLAISVGGTYAALRRLERKGWIITRKDAPQGEGRPPLWFSITPEGITEAKAQRRIARNLFGLCNC